MTDRGDYNKRDEEVEEEEEDEDEERDENFYKAQKDALLIAIEISESMLKQPPHSDDKKADKDSPALAALKCAHQVMQQRIISNPKDMMGILLFGTEKTQYVNPDGKPSALSYPHCYVYTPLDVPSADDVKQLSDFFETGEDEDEIMTPSNEGFKISDLLFCANQCFTSRAPNFGSRRLFIITDNDDPHAGDKAAMSAARTRGLDLYDLGVTIQLFPVSVGDGTFDLAKFYDSIIYRDPAAEVSQPDAFSTSKSGTGHTLLSSLVSNINSKQTPKRALFSDMPLELGPGLRISVKGFNLLQRQVPARSCYIWLDGEKAQIASGETTRLAEDTTRTVETGEIKKAYKFGGEYVYFSPEELKSVKEWGEKVIRIIGFKDRSLLKFWMSIKKSTFIFPTEEGYVGSTRVFSALWQKLLKSNKIGIAWFVARRNANPSLVAIVPSRSQDDDDSGTPYIPAGLWLYPIPYADDVRPGPETKLIRTTDALTDKMNYIVRQLQLPNATYNPEKYPNPALQWHYKILQALALEEEVPDQPQDATVPKNKSIHKRCGEYIEDWAKIADEELPKIQAQMGIKRELDAEEDEDGPRPAKKARKTTAASTSKSDGDSSLNAAALKKKIKAGEISKMKVVELKTVLASRGLDTKGVKADLVDRIEQWAENNL
ncbi:ku70 protein [Xylariales sp. PMI_506]|nr:ku70 protein [Xylariales sp. PMI_506]